MRAGIFGRDAELRALDAFLDGLSSAPSAVVLAGGAGAGKTTLLRAGVEQAADRGYTVLRTMPARSDMRLAFAAMADLLGCTWMWSCPFFPHRSGGRLASRCWSRTRRRYRRTRM